jgi:Ca2+-transporting ATPase
MAIIGIVIFCWFGLSIFWRTTDLLNSLLKGLTWPCRFFEDQLLSPLLWLWILETMKEGVIVKKIRTVETLGSATIICTDKTGTITETKCLQSVYASTATSFMKGRLEKWEAKK